MQKTILVDIDDVTLDLMSVWLNCYNKDYDDNLTEYDIKSWDMSKYVKCGNAIYDYLKYPSLYDNVIPVQGAMSGITMLRAFDYRIIFCTASSPEQSGIKYNLLKHYQLIDEHKNYIEAQDKSLICSDYMLDDNPNNLINAKGKAITYTRQWNRYLRNFDRVYNWFDVITYFNTEKALYD